MFSIGNKPIIVNIHNALFILALIFIILGYCFLYLSLIEDETEIEEK